MHKWLAIILSGFLGTLGFKVAERLGIFGKEPEPDNQSGDIEKELREILYPEITRYHLTSAQMDDVIDILVEVIRKENIKAPIALHLGLLGVVVEMIKRKDKSYGSTSSSPIG